MKDPLQIEWRRLLRHVRRHGPSETTKHVSKLLRQGNYPTYYPYKLSEYLLRRGEFQAAGTLLKATRRFGSPHPLIDKLYGKWLWANGERKSAIRFTEGRAAVWSNSSLFNLLSSMYLVSGNKP